jgi:uncharacterized membrane protein YqjE
MGENNHQPPGMATLLGRLARTGLGAVQNRAELFAVEWQQERARLTELLFWTVGWLFLGMMGVTLLTAVIIFLCPPQARLYVAAGLTVLYLAGAGWAWFVLRSLLRQEPFSGSLEELKKDRAWLESSK